MKSLLADGGPSSRVSIPPHLRETLQSIREITGKQHSDEDIYAVYKESLNDPFETAQKLRFLDTFHEVKSKRDKKKENLVPVTQASARTGRRNFAFSNTYHGNGRSASFKRESGANHVTGGSRTSLPNTHNRARNPTLPRPTKASAPASLPSGVSNHKVEDDSTATVNKGVAEKTPLSKPNSFSEDAVEPETSKPSSQQVSAPVSVSAVQNHIQDVISAQISQSVVNNQPAELQSSSFGRQDISFISASHSSSHSDQVTKNETAPKKGKDRSLFKSDVGERSHVTFPLHLQVAEGLQNGLTFGSFDSDFVKELSSNYGASGGDDSDFKSYHGRGDDEEDSSPIANGIHAVASARGASSCFEDKDHGISKSAPGAELMQHSGHLVSPGEDELREEDLQNTQPHQIAYGQEAPFSVFGLVPSFSALGQPVITEAAETQPGNSNASAAMSLVSYPPGQSSIAAVSQQATQLFGQQYPPSFFPYGPYYPPFYMPPPYIHQFLGPNGIPQQSYFPPAAAPTHIAPVGDNENPPTTNPSQHTSSTVATHIPSAAALNSIHSEERTSPMTGNAAAWIGQGLGNLQLSTMYNLALQGQPLGFPVVQAGHRGLMGIHQPSQPMSVPSATYQTLTPLPPPFTMSAMAEPIRHPNIAQQQPQAAVTNRVNNNY
ncbi:GBF-interacting protein 1-like [Hirschfeldia incana]|nr:GBF-interacting protein 1-like [Hirschfeldia incana]